ncbi:tyrosine-protein kinase HTK16-like [Rhopilema esculentum]|uniref:tyrosine-protein kinase HTK16-like n=1 Tax=Rhopilema esculentum TaxID=499914 RepID=UPI0031D15359
MRASTETLYWYHGRITRDAATHILLSHARSNYRDGCFLVRDCSSAPGDYVISILAHNQVLHFQVHCTGDNRFSIDDGPIFHGLDTLILHYQVKSDGLPCRLTTFSRGSLPPLQALKYGIDTPLHVACLNGNASAVTKLLSEMSTYQEVNSRDEEGRTPLHIASCKGYQDIILLLLNYAADVSASSSTGTTPLQEACAAGHVEAARLLITQGRADVQERSQSNGWVPLHEAALRGNIDCCHLLLSHHASMNPRTMEGDTPRDLALRYNRLEIVEFLDNFPMPPPRTTPSQWLHQNLDRVGAVAMLRKYGMEDGLFLIRSSIKCHGYYVLSMAVGGKAYHFQIKSRADRWYYIDDGPLFETLPHAVDHYSTHMDGLPVLLREAVPPSTETRPAQAPPSRSGPWNSAAPRASPKPPVGSKPLPMPRANLKHVEDDNAGDFNRASSWKNDAPAVPNRTKGSDETKQQTIITRDSLELGKELGQGEFGSVLMGVWINPNGERVSVALKTLHEDKLTQGEQEFLREARVMSNLNHPCIVRLLGVCLGPPMILVQELVSMGALLDYLIDHQSEISQKNLKVWAGQIAWGMTYLEERRFVHRDLATRNILLGTKDQVKISDFGLSRAVGAGSDYYQAKQGGRWPVKWYAPESINYGTFSHKSDVWSYGVTLWEMYTFGELPYGDMAGAQVIAFLERGERLSKPMDCPEKIYQIMLSCWNAEPVNRPSFKNLYATFMKDPEYGTVQSGRNSLKH